MKRVCIGCTPVTDARPPVRVNEHAVFLQVAQRRMFAGLPPPPVTAPLAELLAELARTEPGTHTSMPRAPEMAASPAPTPPATASPLAAPPSPTIEVLPADPPKSSVASFERNPSPLAPLIAYTDGSGTRAHLPSGAGVVIYDGDAPILEASRHLGLGTNNHAELSAVRVALAITDAPEHRARPLIVRSDSEYTIGALTSRWEPREGAANARLIAIIRKALRTRAVTFEHVKGHAGIEGNERADKLAGLARLRTQSPATAQPSTMPAPPAPSSPPPPTPPAPARLSERPGPLPAPRPTEQLSFAAVRF